MKPLADLNEMTLSFCGIFVEPKQQPSRATSVATPEQFATMNSSCPTVEFGRILGSGGFGKVYEALFNGKKVAVKKLTSKAKLRNSNAPRESLQAESLLLEYSHQNLVKILAILHGGSIEDCMVIMEFAGERNLQSIIDDESVALPERRRISVALDIARGLEFMHKQGLAHLDVKPANVIVNADNECKICDFGCCQYVELEESKDFQPPSPTKTSLAGTFSYRAPELLKGEFPSTKADIYSLGVCLWQMLLREQPYGMESHFVIIFSVVQKNLRPRFPEAILEDERNLEYVRLTTSLWHAEARKRPAAKELVRSLQNWTNL